MKPGRALRLFGPAVGVFLLIAGDLVGYLSGAEHYGGFWNHLPLWDLAFGFVGGGLLILGAKTLVKRALGRPDDYYAEPPSPPPDDGGLRL